MIEIWEYGHKQSTLNVSNELKKNAFIFKNSKHIH